MSLNQPEQQKSQKDIALIDILQPQAIVFLISTLGPSMETQRKMPLLSGKKVGRGGVPFSPGTIDTKPPRAGNQ